MSTSVLQIRVDADLKAKAAVIYEKLGIDLPTAVRIFLKRSIMENGLPFEMTLPTEKKVPTERHYRNPGNAGGIGAERKLRYDVGRNQRRNCHRQSGTPRKRERRSQEMTAYLSR